jgi:YD repeat-containing protein
MPIDEGLAVVRLRQWAALRIRNQSGKIREYKYDGWQRRIENRFDAGLVMVIDFERALNKLTDEQKLALVLRYRDKQTDPEIAIALGCSIRKVTYLVPIARRKLAEVLDRLNLL